jgi:geranylgeranyl reductase family protein
VERADVLIVGGGPAGSSCARALAGAGRDVLVVDAHSFPRDKPCAGWITPEVVAETGLPLEDYALRHTLQAINRFRVGRIGAGAVDVEYPEIVSYGIRRCEFDAFLLGQSGARTRHGERVTDIRREGGRWVVNGRLSARTLVGAGGHFCPVRRLLNGSAPPASTVVAREIELPLEGEALEACRVRPERPELYFCRDLRGYGWCFRKGEYLNVGLGRRDAVGLPAHLEEFLAFLVREGRIAALPPTGWHGHAYVLHETGPRRLAAEDVLLAGDAAGLAVPASGEGILPAVVSGRLAAEAILDPGAGVERYPQSLAAHLGAPQAVRRAPGPLTTAAGALLLATPWLVRRVVLDRFFLHRRAS